MGNIQIKLYTLNQKKKRVYMQRASPPDYIRFMF